MALVCIYWQYWLGTATKEATSENSCFDWLVEQNLVHGVCIHQTSLILVYQGWEQWLSYLEIHKYRMSHLVYM